MTATKCTKKRDARAKIVVLLIKPIVFLKFSLPSPLSDLNVPIVMWVTGKESAINHAVTFSFCFC